MIEKEQSNKKEIFKKWWFWVIIFWVLTIGFGVSGELSNTTNTQNGIENQTSQISNNNNETLQQNSNNSNNNETQQQDSKNSDNNKEKSRVSQLKLETLDVYNGFKTEVIGKCHVIKADKKTIFDFSADEWLEFKATFIDTHKEDNWLTIYFGDNTGIIFTGMDYMGTLCNIDPSDQCNMASSANQLELIEIFSDEKKVKYELLKGKINYFKGLDK